MTQKRHTDKRPNTPARTPAKRRRRAPSARRSYTIRDSQTSKWEIYTFQQCQLSSQNLDLSTFPIQDDSSHNDKDIGPVQSILDFSMLQLVDNTKEGNNALVPFLEQEKIPILTPKPNSKINQEQTPQDTQTK